MLRPPLKAATFQALFGLLAVSGMRVGEAVALEVADVDLDDGVITIREQIAKLDRARAGSGVSEEPCKCGRKDEPCPRELRAGLIRKNLSARSEATPAP